jgi:GNAT superfamily N-acetyltransferase
MYEQRSGDFLISTDPDRLQLDVIDDLLSRAYWAQGRSRQVIIRSIENSLCFGVYAGEAQVGFARVVTDFATYAWLCDVIIREDLRGRGLGKALLGCILSHPELQGLRRWALATRDAHELYKKFGFSGLKNPEGLMEAFYLSSEIRSDSP